MTKMRWFIIVLVLLLGGCGAQAEKLPTDEEIPEETEPVTEETIPLRECVEEKQAASVADPTKPEPTEPENAKPVQPEPPAATNPPDGEPQIAESLATAHTHSYSSSIAAPTCTSGGYTIYACSCGESYMDHETAATGHNWGDWVTTKEATTEAEGEKTRTCAQCGAAEAKSIPKLEPVALDYAAAVTYGNTYAASTYGWIVDDSLNADNAGYDFPLYCGLDIIQKNGGQSELNRKMAAAVDSTYQVRVQLYGDGSGYYVNCFAYESDGWVYFYVYYG